MEKKDLRVTAAIPAYNSGKYLATAIKSVLEQTRPPYECIVIDDGSSDDTADVARSFADVHYIRQDNGGDANARNRAISEATGNCIAFLDADDVWLPDKIELQVARLAKQPDLGMVYTGVRVVDEGLRPLEDLTAAPGNLALRNTLLVEKPYMTGVGSSGLVPIEVARQTRFDERLGASADWAFACHVALRHPVEAVDRPLVLYRQHAETQVHRNLRAVEHDMQLVWSEVFGNGLLPAELGRYERRAHANLYLSLAASYFKRGDRADFARYLGRALIRRPDRVIAALWRRYMVPPA